MLLCICLTACAVEPEFFDTQGRKVEFKDAGGKLLLINYWAEWCKPCLEEIPQFNVLALEHGERVRILGVNFDALLPGELKIQARRLGISYPVLTKDPSKYLKIASPEVLPTSYLFDADQKLIKVFVGPQTASSILRVVDSN